MEIQLFEVRKSKCSINGNEIDAKRSNEGMFNRWTFKFTSTGVKLGEIFIKPKRGWNQLHIGISEEYQGKGYGADMIKYVVNELGYVTIQDGRIINNMIYRIIEKISNDKNFITFRYGESETVIHRADLDNEYVMSKVAI